ncbi:hypothetical protein [Paenibacillus sp. FSL H8-0034]|uniref:hypothetical protein n=1 Tax=Paenibacillus sp. FSL H8-0034 TaxID=2954671 RepID=UPI0030F73B6F
MKKFFLGLACGILVTASTATYASDTIQAYLFPVGFELNGQEKKLDNEYAILNYKGHAYVLMYTLMAQLAEPSMNENADEL